MDQYSTFKNEKEFEDALTNYLINECGWKDGVLMYPSEDKLYENWANILYRNNRQSDKLGDYPLSQNEINQLKSKYGGQSPFQLNNVLVDGKVSITRDVDSPDEQHRGVVIYLDAFDRYKITDGATYQIARQAIFKGGDTDSRRGDITLLINGIPVIHIELKRNASQIYEATNQIEKYTKEHRFTGIMSFVQIFVAMTPDDVLYFANPGTDGKFNRDFFFRWGDRENIPVTQWDKFAKSFLSRIFAHEFIGFYTVTDKSEGDLKVLRSYQLNAVEAIVNQIKKYHWGENKTAGKGGFVWQTTGSGKTLTSYKAADVVAKRRFVDNVIFLVDRTELNVQSKRHYESFAENKTDIHDTSSSSDLLAKMRGSLTDKFIGSKDTNLIITSIQKASRIKGSGNLKRRENDLEIINKKKNVFIVDECHRDTFGQMMENVKDTFNTALFFGFTGTPILDENAKKGCTSTDVFGDELEIARYTIAEGIRDNNVLKLNPCPIPFPNDEAKREQVANYLSNNGKNAAKYEEVIYSMKMAGYKENGKYIQGVEDFISAGSYNNPLYRDQVVDTIINTFKYMSRGGKFHALFATSSIPEAIEYYSLFKKRAPEIYTTVLVDKNDDNTKISYEKIEGLKIIIEDYNQRYKDSISTPYDIKSYDKKMKKDIAERLSHVGSYKNMKPNDERRIDILIVVNQMLTGFDSKYVNTLYLDKVLEKENIIQAFSRTNRKLDQQKPAGLIYYIRQARTMERNIDEALDIYAGSKKYMVYVDKLEKNVERFNLKFDEIKTLFENEDILDFSHLPESPTAQSKFSHLFNELNDLYEMIRVQGFRWTQTKYGDTILELDEDTFQILLQRYRDLYKNYQSGSTGDGWTLDIDPRVANPEEGKQYDFEYLNGHYQRYYQLTKDKATDEELDELIGKLNRDIAKLSQEDQIYARLIINDVKRGMHPDKNKSFDELINEYKTKNTNTMIHKFAERFGLDETLLTNILGYSKEHYAQHGRYEKLLKTADEQKIYQFYKEKDSTISEFKANIEFDNLLKRFIESGGFDIDDIYN